MHFYFDRDEGTSVRFWIVPDNPSAISRVNVSLDGVHAARFDAWITDPVIRSNGWHSTGQCVFDITEGHLPGLAAAARVEIYDGDTNVLIYRRSPDADLIQRKFLLLETSVNADTTLQPILFHRFQQSYFGIGGLPEEVLRSLFHSPWLTSSMLTGSVPLAKYEGHLAGGNTLTAALVHDPFVEMANRLLWLKARSGIASDPAKAWRTGAMAEACRSLADHDLTDAKAIKRFFGMMPETAYRFLYNPLTRQFSLSLPDDRLLPGHSIVAIEIMARTGIVGHRDYYEAFVETLFHRLGVDAPIPAPPPIPPEALALAERLRGIRFAKEMLVFDTAMADAIRSAVSKGWAK